MTFDAATFGLAYLAGLLSTLSPCVLPLVPILLASAASAHRFGPVALTAGLAVSFTSIGLLLATVGAGLGLDPATLRQGAAVVMLALGAVMLSGRLQGRLALATSGLGSAGDSLLSRIRPEGWRGQFAIGAVLGVVWSPCVGPTLGAASTLAAQGRELPQVAALMLVFGVGAGSPLLAIGALSKSALARWRGRFLRVGQAGKAIFGSVLIVVSLAILTGADRHLEAWAVDATPAWLTSLTTRF